MSNDFSANSDKEECRIGNYMLLHSIEKRGFAEVKLAQHVLTGTDVVVKVVSLRVCAEALSEAHCLKGLNHPTIMKLIKVIVTQDKMFIFMEYVSGGDLFDYLHDHGCRT